MGKNLIEKYLLIIDILTRYKSLSKKDLNKIWRESGISNGEELPDRTFYHYRRSIEEIFNIRIECDKSGRYFIDEDGSSLSKSITNTLLESAAVSSVVQNTNFPAGRMEIEDVPSAREFLPIVVEGIKLSRKLEFTYAGFSRSRSETGIVFEPYFLKRYKQRWYMIGLKEKGSSIRTYALDRVTQMVITDDNFDMPDASAIKDLFSNIVGVTTSQAPVRNVILRVTPTQAKYFRALPLHPSQNEEVGDSFSLFTYKLKLNYELVHEILSFGDAVAVESPKELKAMVVTELKQTLAKYEKTETVTPLK